MQNSYLVENSVRNKVILTLFAMFLLLALYNIIYERIPWNQGLGFDGAGYYEVTTTFIDKVNRADFSSYSVQRLLPSAIVFFSLDSLGRSFTPDIVIRAFIALNFSLLILAFYLWTRVIRILGFGITGSFISIVLLFFNFAILKHGLYYPVLTDTTAFFLGVTMIYAYFSKKNSLLILLLILSAFTWPYLKFAAAFLFIFPYGSSSQHEVPALVRKVLKLTAIVSSGLFIVLSGYMFYVTDNMYSKYLPLVIRELLPLSILSFAALLFYFFQTLAFTTIKLSFSISSVVKRSLIVIVILAITSYIQFLITDPSKNPEATILTFVETVLVGNSAAPLKFFISHFIYFGIAFILFVFFFKRIFRSLEEFGTGFTLVFLSSMAFIVFPEPRIYTPYFPFLVLLISGSAIESLRKKTWILVTLLVVNLLMSRTYIPVNIEGIERIRVEDFSLPGQSYFSTQGLWMNKSFYFLYAGIFLLLLLSFFFWFRKEKVNIQSA